MGQQGQQQVFSPDQVQAQRLAQAEEAKAELERAQATQKLYERLLNSANERLAQLNAQPLPTTEQAAVEFVGELATLRREAEIWGQVARKVQAQGKAAEIHYKEIMEYVGTPGHPLPPLHIDGRRIAWQDAVLGQK